MGCGGGRAGVAIAGGDTKVVEHGKADQMYISSCRSRMAEFRR